MGTNDDTNDAGNNQGGGKSLIEQASNALNKAAKESTVNKLKEILKRRGEHLKGVALCDAEAKKLVEDHEAGLL